MLQAIRESVKGWVAAVIIGLLVIPFAFWGIQSYFQTEVDTYVAKIDDYKIDVLDYQRAYQSYRVYMRQVSGGSINATYFEQPAIKRQFVEGLINDQLLIATAESAGYAIPDEVLAAQIRNSPGFQVDGVFSPQRYQQVLRTQRMSPAQFEKRMRRAQLVSRIPDTIQESGFVLDAEVDALVALETQQRDISYVVVSASQFEDLFISDEEIQAYYDEFDTEFLTPERVSIEYVELVVENMLDEVRIDEAVLLSEYEAQKDRYILPEERRAAHILIEVSEDADEAAAAAAETRARELAERARAGEDFATLAAEHSDDPGAAAEGGSLGWIARGGTVAPVEEALFAMTEGTISDPVRSGFGYHVLWLEEIRESRGKSFEEVRATLETEYRQRTAEDIFFERSDRLFDLTYENPGTLEPAAAELGLEIQTSEMFTRSGGPGVAANSQVVEAAFSEDVLLGGNNSNSIDIGANHLVVIRISEHEPASRRPLDEVSMSIRARLMLEKRSDMAAAKADELLARGVQGESLTDIAAVEGLEVVDTGPVQRTDTGQQDPAFLADVFRLPAPATGATWHTLALSNGDHSVVVLQEVRPGSASEADAAARERARGRLEQLIGRDSAELMETLNAQADIEVIEDRL